MRTDSQARTASSVYVVRVTIAGGAVVRGWPWRPLPPGP
jgi:hypothetical protein